MRTLSYEIFRELARHAKAYEKACEYIFSQEGSSLSHYRFYNLYYTSQAVFHASPEKWRTWNANNINRLLPSQKRNENLQVARSSPSFYQAYTAPSPDGNLMPSWRLVKYRGEPELFLDLTL